MQDLTITFIQTSLVWEDKEKNLEHFEKLINSVKKPTHLIILPEMFNTGFSMEAPKLAETMDGPAMQWMKRIAQNKNAVLTGSFIVKDNMKYFNRLVWMMPDGEYKMYDKRHLFRMGNEDKIFTAGSQKLTVELNGWRICPLICYDLRFPVWCRNQSEYDCLIFVANWPEIRNYPWKTLLLARAIENQCYVVGVNRVGIDGKGISHSGNSCVVDFKGNILFTKDNEPCIHTSTLSYKDLSGYRKAFPVASDADDFEIKLSK